MVFSTQQSVDIAGIKDGVIIMKDGSYRLILQVAAVNFALKSEQEQNSLVFQYQSFLNSLHFPIEVVIRSRRLDLSPYLKSIADRAKEQTNELIKMQSEDYVEFVGKLITLANIMKKTFYVAIPYNPISIKQANVFDKLFSKAQIYDHIKISDMEFESQAQKLKERANIIASGLGSIGLHCFQLSTEEIIEMFYQIYNPDEAQKEPFSDAENLSSPVIISKTEVASAKKKETAASEEEERIDNSAIVVAQHKQEAELRKQEQDKTAEKEIRQPGENEPETKQTEADAQTPKPSGQASAQPAAVNPEPKTAEKQSDNQPISNA